MTLTGPGGRATGAAIVDRIAFAPVGSRRVEATLAWLMSVFGVLFSLESLPSLVAEWHRSASTLGVLQVVLLYGMIGLAGLAAVTQQWTRPVFTAVAVVYLVAVAVWPLALVEPMAAGRVPWIVALAGVAGGFVTIAARRWSVPIVYSVVVALALGLIRTSPIGGGLLLRDAAGEVAYDLVVSVALVAVVVSVRLAAQQVDRAQTAALNSYADAQVDEATETERTLTDALVHDSVLTTFLSAASAGSPEAMRLAARMAANTMQVLSRATVASSVGPRVPVRDLFHRLEAGAAGLGNRFEYSVQDVRDRFVPENVADAVVSAAVQAMTNSVKHAGGPEVHRSVVIKGTRAGGLEVIVSDEGKGFDPSAVASERLGLRISILERMRRVGGEVDISTAPGRGATFVLSWPAAAHAALRPVLEDSVVGA